MTVFGYLVWVAIVFGCAFFVVSLLGVSRKFNTGKKVVLAAVTALIVALSPYVVIAIRTSAFLSQHGQLIRTHVHEESGRLLKVWCISATSATAEYYVRYEINDSSLGPIDVADIVLVSFEEERIVGFARLYGGNQEGWIFPPDPEQSDQ